MIEVICELNGVKQKCHIPTSWKEVTFKQFLELDGAKESKALSIFTGIEEKTLKKAKIRNLDKVMACLSFLQFNLDIKFDKKFPAFDYTAFGKYSDIKEIIATTENDKLIYKYPLLYALYECEPYDYDTAAEKVGEYEKKPCEEVVAMGNFLLLKLIELNVTISKTSLQHHTRLKRWRLVFRAWRSRLAFQVRYFFWKPNLSTLPSRLKNYLFAKSTTG